MKSNSKPNHSLSSRANRAFEQARTQFGRAVIDVLSNSLEALGGRLGGEKLETFQDPGRIEDQPRHRLRRMLQTDRGLGARDYESGRSVEPLEIQAPTPRPSAIADPPDEAHESIAVAPAALESMTVVEPEAPAPNGPAVEVETTAAVTEPEQREETASPPVVPESECEPTPIAAATPPDVGADLTSKPEPSAMAPDEPPVCDEPIRTRSMARLLASQGHHRRALSIYDVLLASNASDAALVAEAAALRSLAEQQPPAPAPQ